MESNLHLPTYNESISHIWREKDNVIMTDFPALRPANAYRLGSSTGLFRDLNYSNYSNSSGSIDIPLNLISPVISFQNLSYTVSTRNKGAKCGTTDKLLLNDVSGMFKKGMNAIMGPTGCGKTTLLDILAGRKDPSKLSGNVLVDGCKQPAGFNFMSGYVRQDDQVMGTLTVKENLMFSAHTRLPSSTKKKEKESKVEQLIQELGLSKCANTKIGNEFIRGVSGGERKRTCIGMELLVSRGVLFLDEPTTGLDAFTASSVMTLLQRLSASGMTIIFSIHQPRYNIFKVFDTLMLLASGHVIFHGKAAKALDFFHEQDFKCDAHNNPPDFFLDIINGDVSSHSSLSSSNTNSTSSSMPWITHSPTDQVFKARAFGYSLDDLKKGSIVPALSKRFRESHFYESWNRKMNETINEVKVKRYNKNQISEHSKSFISQLYYVSKRTLKNIVRNPAAMIAQIAVMITFALLIGILYFDLTKTDQNIFQNRSGSFYIIILVNMFGNLGVIELFIKERSLFLHECKSGYYKVSGFFFSKMFCDLIPQRIIPLAMFCVITYFMMGLKRTVEHFFIFLLNLFLVTLCSAVMMILISACCRVFAIANILAGLLILIMTLFGGLLINVTTIPTWIRWLQYISIVRYGFKVLLINEMKDAEYPIDAPYPANVTLYGNNYLENQDVAYKDPWDLWQNMLALGVATLILAVLCYVRLWIMVWKKVQ